MTHSDAIVKFIASFEGYRSEAYQDGAGIWTLGYGSTTGIKQGMTCTPEGALILLDHDVLTADNAVNSCIKTPLTQWQFDALVSWTFNLGWGNLQHSTLAADLNAGHFDAAAVEILKWNKVAGKVSEGLVRRRQGEQDIFLGKGYGDIYPGKG